MLKRVCVVAAAMAALLMVGSPAFASSDHGSLIGNILENVSVLDILSKVENTDVDVDLHGYEHEGYEHRRECCEHRRECCEHHRDCCHHKEWCHHGHCDDED